MRIPLLPEQVRSSPSCDGRPCRGPQSGRSDAVAGTKSRVGRNVYAGMKNPEPCAQGITGDEFVLQCGLGDERPASAIADAKASRSTLGARGPCVWLVPGALGMLWIVSGADRTGKVSAATGEYVDDNPHFSLSP